MLHEVKTRVLATLAQETVSGIGSWKAKPAILVVGCGNGTEAAVFSRLFGVRATGIDLGSHFAFAPSAMEVADLLIGDATELPFADASFDFLFSHHTLEHIVDCSRALSEMQRVLVPGGSFLLGTPNKNRFLAYWSSEGMTLRKWLRYNWADWKKRWRGQFENRFGAHAGFSEPELRAMLGTVFSGELVNLSPRYYLTIYARYRWLVMILIKTGLSKFLFPALYFVGTKAPLHIADPYPASTSSPEALSS